MSNLIKLPMATSSPAQQDWTESLAGSMAMSDDLVLNDAHMEVIHYLRRCHVRFGRIKNTRSLLLALETRFALQGGKQFLQTLFPEGAICQACLLAGIPWPQDFDIGIENKKTAL